MKRGYSKYSRQARKLGRVLGIVYSAVLLSLLLAVSTHLIANSLGVLVLVIISILIITVWNRNKNVEKK